MQHQDTTRYIDDDKDIPHRARRATKLRGGECRSSIRDVVEQRTLTRLPLRPTAVAKLLRATTLDVVASLRELHDVLAVRAPLPPMLLRDCEQRLVPALLCVQARRAVQVRRLLAAPARLRATTRAPERGRGGRRASEEGRADGVTAVHPVLGAELARLALVQRHEGLLEMPTREFELDDGLAAFRWKERLVLGGVLEHDPEAGCVEEVPAAEGDDGAVLDLVLAHRALWHWLWRTWFRRT
ncbi:hypothetical protein C8Q76DRAFT_280955 [Earliella scabrosa]|nr:hypothetical protein C8Q76DRAFT_280955 [Earliella scabrosa]